MDHQRLRRATHGYHAPQEYGHHAIAMIPETPFDIGVTIGSLSLGATGPVARESASFFRTAEQGVNTIMREGAHLLRTTEQTRTRQAFAPAHHTASKTRNSAYRYFEQHLPDTIERTFSSGGYTKAERDLLQYGDMFGATGIIRIQALQKNF